MNNQELTNQAIQVAFDKLPRDEQNKLLYLCKNLNRNRTKPMPDPQKIELLGKLGMWIVQKYPLYQCGSCENTFTKLTADYQCPFCGSGNWVEGFLDE